jgi:phenylalanine-4-hydroxylase
LFLTESLPSVAAGPADPAAWDRWFGELNAFAEGDSEAHARARKVAALDGRLAALYTRVRVLREGGAGAAELRALRSEVAAFPDEWLLREELDEIAATAAA